MKKKEKIQAKKEAMHILIGIDEIINLLKHMEVKTKSGMQKANKNAISKSRELQNFIIMNFTDNKR